MVEFCIGKHTGRNSAKAVLQAMPRFQREVSPVGRVRGLFRKRSGVFKGIPSLCKCYNACEVWYHCKSGDIAVKTAHHAPRAAQPGEYGGLLLRIEAVGRIGVGTPSTTAPLATSTSLSISGAGPARCGFGAPAPAGPRAPLRIWAGVVRNASGFAGFGRIRVDSVRLRRILDHMPAKPLFPPETQTHFGPPNRWSARPQDRQTAGPREARHPRIDGSPAMCGTPRPKIRKPSFLAGDTILVTVEGVPVAGGAFVHGSGTRGAGLGAVLEARGHRGGVDASCGRRGAAGRRAGAVRGTGPRGRPRLIS